LGPKIFKGSQFWTPICGVSWSRYSIHSYREHKATDIWFQNLLHLKKDRNADVWTQLLHQQYI